MGTGPLAPITIAVVEDEEVVTAGIRQWLSDDPMRRAILVQSSSTVEGILAGPGGKADVLVLDLELKGRMITDRIGELSTAGHRVVVFSHHIKPLVIKEALSAGALAFLDKYSDAGQFVDAIVAVGQDRPVVTQSMAGGMLEATQLSERERETLMYLFQGMSHGSIARRMAISETTVKDYVKRARAKFAAQGRPCASSYALLARCIEDGYIRPEEIAEYRSRAALPDEAGPS